MSHGKKYGGYIKDPNDPKKQVPGPKPPNYYGSTAKPVQCIFHKTPNSVYVNKTIQDDMGFFFGDSASFSSACVTQGGGATLTNVSGSNYASDWGLLAVGTKLDIHPTAWSGSSRDAGSITFIYQGGLDGQGRP